MTRSMTEMMKTGVELPIEDHRDFNGSERKQFADPLCHI